MGGGNYMNVDTEVTNRSLRQLSERIRTLKSLLLTTHREPDGDGLGAVLALAIALRAQGMQVSVFLPDPCPDRFRFLDPEGILRHLAEDAPDIPIENPEMALVIDTHQWAMIGHVGELIQARGIPTLFLDHHPLREETRNDIYGDPNACSTGELMYSLLIYHLDLPIDARIGECLYTSIAYDTHSFRYVRNNPSPHLVAADLLSRGVDATRIYRHLFASNPVGKMRLLGQVLASALIMEDGRLAYVALPLTWIQQHGVCPDDLRDTVNTLLEVQGVEVAVMLKESEDGTIRVSLRSKGEAVVNGAAMRLGGGGHIYASGATIPGPLDEAERRVMDEVLEIFRNAGAEAGKCGTASETRPEPIREA